MLSPSRPFKVRTLQLSENSTSLPIHIPSYSIWHPNQQYLVIHLIEETSANSFQSTKKHVIEALTPYVQRQFDHERISDELKVSYYHQCLCAYRALDFSNCLDILLTSDNDSGQLDEGVFVDELSLKLWKKNLVKIKFLCLSLFVALVDMLKRFIFYEFM